MVTREVKKKEKIGLQDMNSSYKNCSVRISVSVIITLLPDPVLDHRSCLPDAFSGGVSLYYYGTHTIDKIFRFSHRTTSLIHP